MDSLDKTTETQRLQALYEYDILDTPADGAYDAVTLLASRYFNVPISIISLVDHNRIWFKSRVGVNVDEIDREPGLCASVVMDDSVYVVTNAIEDPRTLSNPLVASSLGLRFYAGAPILSRDGHRLGSMAVIDVQPRDFSPKDAADLNLFACIVAEQLNLRLAARKLTSGLSRILGKAPQESDELLSMLKMCAWTKKIHLNDKWMTFEEFLTGELGIVISHGISPEAVELLQDN